MKAHGFKLLLFFLLPVGLCIDVNFSLSILAYVTISSFVSRMSNHYTLFTREDTFTKEISVIDEFANVAVG